MTDQKNEKARIPQEKVELEQTSQLAPNIEAALAAVDETAARLDDQSKTIVKDLITALQERLTGVQFRPSLISDLIASLDQMISGQLDEILHHESFQKVEAAWRGLRWLIERTDSREGIELYVYNATKDEILNDFESSPGDVRKTRTYQLIHDKEYGVSNGKPYGKILLAHEFSHTTPDVELLKKVCEVSQLAHAPVIAGVSPRIFGPRGLAHLEDIKYSVSESLNGPEYAAWNGLREEEYAKNLALVLPSFVLRMPYSEDSYRIKDFRYNEKVGGDTRKYLWGNAAYAFSSLLTAAFARYHWCWQIVGEEAGGLVKGMSVPTVSQAGETVQLSPVGISLTHERAYELNESGLIAFEWRKHLDSAVIYGAPSFKKVPVYPNTEDGRKKQKDEQIRSMIPFRFIQTRFAHYIKRLQTRHLGKATTATELQKELQEWISQYVNDVEKPSKDTLGKYPLKKASVKVEEDERRAGWFLCHFSMTPHTMIEGFKTSLELVTQQGGLKAN